MTFNTKGLAGKNLQDTFLKAESLELVFSRIFDKDQVYVHVTYGDIISNKDTGFRWDIRKECGKDNYD